MNSKEVLSVIDETFESIQNIFSSKGREYANDEKDQLMNFKRQGTELGVPPELILNVYLSKHIDSVRNFIKVLNAEGFDKAVANLEQSEPIDGRINDIILYSFLLKCLISERRKEHKSNES